MSDVYSRNRWRPGYFGRTRTETRVFSLFGLAEAEVDGMYGVGIRQTPGFSFPTSVLGVAVVATRLDIVGRAGRHTRWLGPQAWRATARREGLGFGHVHALHSQQSTV